MATKLKNMKLTSVDLCKRGANPYADIKLFKSEDSMEGGENKVSKDENHLFAKMGKAIAKVLGLEVNDMQEQMAINKSDCISGVQEMTLAIQKSLTSIIDDDSLDSVAKSEHMQEALKAFVDDATQSLEDWSQVVAKKSDEDEDDDEDDDEGKEIQNIPESEDIDPKTGKLKKQINSKEDNDIMATFDIEKMSAEDKATLEALEKKYAVEKSAEKGEAKVEGIAELIKPAEMHPEVKKALDEMETLKAETASLKKSLEIKELETVAKKYEIIGKDPAELAGKLYDLKKSGDAVYNDYTALLDEQVKLAEGGIFKEFGSNKSGGASDLNGIVSEIMKAEPTLSRASAIVKAYETHPELDQFTGKN